MKKIIALTLGAACLLSAYAEIPERYYNTLSGKKEAALKEAAKKLADGHTVIKYGEDTWTAFELTDVVLVNGRAAWRDMYSNELVWVASGHGSLNIEHSVPKSWWGGEVNEAYQDLFHLNPSNPNANNRKSNWPLGEIMSLSWTNGISSLGSPTSKTGGGSKTVFEPAEEFKGDFARAYFYIFTTYDLLDWDTETDWMYDEGEWSYPTLRPWATDMLLEWARLDPVDSAELARNEAIYAIQGNRNPFIDIPELAEYIWGTKKETAFNASGIQEPVPVERPDAPVFGDYEITAFNTYSGRWWEPFTLKLKSAPGATIQYNVDGCGWMVYNDSGIQIPEALQEGETTKIEARAQWTVDGLTLVSPVSTLLLTAKDPDVTDYKESAWRLVTEDAEIDSESLYVLVSSKTSNIMSRIGDSSSSNKYVMTAGTVNVTDGWITSIPENSAIISFPEASECGINGEYPTGSKAVAVKDLRGASEGYLYSSKARQMVISTDHLSAVTVSVSDNMASIDFGTTGRLQFNVSSPRFVPYTSNQEPVCLYVLDPLGPPVNLGVNDVNTDNAPERVFDLQGREMTGRELAPGLYIVISNGKATKIIR